MTVIPTGALVGICLALLMNGWVWRGVYDGLRRRAQVHDAYWDAWAAGYLKRVDDEHRRAIAGTSRFGQEPRESGSSEAQA